MQGQSLHKTLKVVGHVVLLLMAVGMAWAAYISIKYWNGIGV